MRNISALKATAFGRIEWMLAVREFRSFNLTVSIGQTRKDPKLQISSFFVS